MDTRRRALYGIRIQICLTDMLLPSSVAHMRYLLQCILLPMVMTVTGAELACPPPFGQQKVPSPFQDEAAPLYRLLSKVGLW